ncbi:MAG TPA: hypothetical protein VLR29_05200 [Flavobacterium sp.]|nr:hypothetical protein [Flavobacterium sp.]
MIGKNIIALNGKEKVKYDETQVGKVKAIESNFPSHHQKNIGDYPAQSKKFIDRDLYLMVFDRFLRSPTSNV